MQRKGKTSGSLSSLWGINGEADLWRGLPSSSAAPPGFDMLRSRVQATVGVQPYHQSQQVRITRRGSVECS
jgi:hypothetical protein